MSTDILNSPRKPKVPFTSSTIAPRYDATQINNSMRMRREQAWATVQQVWQPVTVQGTKIPAWVTWYEEEDVAELYRALLRRRGSRNTSTPADIDAVLTENSLKDSQTSLSSTRLGKVLRQFIFPGIPSLGPDRKPKTGVVYFNRAYVRHLLENAERIIQCEPTRFPTLSFPGTEQLGSSPTLSIGINNPLLPSLSVNPQNQWALCMDREMPAAAMMLKVSWVPVIKYDAAGNGYVDEHEIDTSARMATKLTSLPSGQWIELPRDANSRAQGGIRANGFRVTDEKGKQWELRGMHITRKNVRTWTWTTIFEAGGNWNWGADKPAELTNQWTSLANYGMCTVSDFREADPVPWAAYEGKGEHLQSLADTIKAVARVMNGAQWCSNPYIETNMAFGNCVGCHQGSTETFLPTTVFQAAVVPANQTLDRLIPETILRTTQIKLPFNTSDFSFSFATNRAAFQEAQRLRNRDR